MQPNNSFGQKTPNAQRPNNYQNNQPAMPAKNAVPTSNVATPAVTRSQTVSEKVKVPITSQTPLPPEKVKIPTKDRLARMAYQVFLATLVLAPIAFIPTRYIAIDLAKTVIIVLGTLVSAILYLLVIMKERQTFAPPKTLFITAILLCVAAIISSLSSIQISKSLFGQGFEIGTAGFLITLFVAAWVAYETVRRDPKRTTTIFSVLGVVFLVFFLFQGLRLVTSSSILSLGILSNRTDTLLGKWPELAIFAMLILIAVSSTIAFLTIPKRKKIIYYVVGVIALVTTLLVNNSVTWIAAAIAFGVVAVGLFANASKAGLTGFRGILSRISWLPTLLCIVAILAAVWGTVVMKPVIQKTGTQYSELSLPWQMTLDVIAGSVKNYPWFGVGPNHFAQAFMTYKPQGFNTTDLWQVEFNVGSGLVPTYFAMLGIIGVILWILLFVFLGFSITKALRTTGNEPFVRFTVVGGAIATIFLWIMTVLYVPSHFMVFLTFAVTGIFVANCVTAKILDPYILIRRDSFGRRTLWNGAIVVLVALFVVSLGIYGKKTVSMAYFASGVRQISEHQNYDGAIASFRTALSFDKSDVYWQAISESDRLKATQLVSTATSSSPALAIAISKTITDGVQASRSAIVYDPSNYYNLLSEARISQLGASLKITNAYDNAARAYTNAIRVNPLNPALYVNLAQLEASNNNLDQALQTLGAGLQIKSNYLDAVFLLSQVHAARGDLNNAIIAAQVAIQLNPQNPLLYFQLGLLEYNAQNYKISEQALAKAVELQPDYANAKYFLGLAAARDNNIALAVAEFSDLSKANPDNQEVATILNNLRAGNSPFANAPAAPASTPEKRTTLPLKEKK